MATISRDQFNYYCTINREELTDHENELYDILLRRYIFPHNVIIFTHYVTRRFTDIALNAAILFPGRFVSDCNAIIRDNSDLDLNIINDEESGEPIIIDENYKSESTKDIMLYDGKTVKFDDNVVHIPDFGVYALKNDPNVTKDYLTNNFILNNYKGIKLATIYDSISNEGILQSVNNYKTIHGNNRHFNNVIITHIPNGNICLCTLDLMNDKVFKYWFNEQISTGIFVHKSILPKDHPELKSKSNKTVYRKRQSGALDFIEYLKENNIPNTYVNTFGKQYSYGLEIETCSGILPHYLDKSLFYSAVHDGSLRNEDGNVIGGEYVTAVLKGDQGLLQLKKLCYELTKRCLVDRKCGVHVHLGDVVFTKENVVLLYYICYKLQSEIFKMLPPSRSNNEYCRFLDNVDKLSLIKDVANNIDRNYNLYIIYNNIIKYLSSKSAPTEIVNKKCDHPMGHKCGYNHKAARYCWVNFIPAVFNTRKNNVYTIEFRPMQASTSYYKIKNWLFICMALVDLVENHKQFIYNRISEGSLNLTDILVEVYGKNAKSIIKYVDERKAIFSEMSKPDNKAILATKEQQDYDSNELDNNFSVKSL